MPTTNEKIVDLARSYIGKVAYVFGASDPEGGRSDCSGFTQYIYNELGYDIPRTTGGVWTSDLPKVDRDDLQPGDLILFKGTYNSGYKDGVSHIGIYAGENRFIHCGSNDGVTESSLLDPYYANHYLGAMRVTGAVDPSSDPSESSQGENSDKSNQLGLEWWGDIVKVVIAALLILGGVVLLVLGVKSTIWDKIGG